MAAMATVEGEVMVGVMVEGEETEEQEEQEEE